MPFSHMSLQTREWLRKVTTEWRNSVNFAFEVVTFPTGQAFGENAGGGGEEKEK